MTRTDRATIESEIGMIEEMLQGIEVGRVIERVGLEARLASLRDELEHAPVPAPLVTLTFRGEPVDENRAIQAEFGGKAAALFSEAVATVSASLTTQLGTAGPLPRGADRHLRIVGTAVGSFGFELELPPPDDETLPGLLPEMSDAVESTLALIREAGSGDEEALSELIAATHPRAAAKVQEFVKHVVDRNAVFGVSFGPHRTGIHDASEGRTVLERLSLDQIEQTESTMDATLIGVLPEARRFEARRADGEVVRGRIDRELDPKALIDDWLNRTARLRLRATKVRSARPSYVLLAIDEHSGGVAPPLQGQEGER